MKQVARISVILLLLLTGINAVIAGLLFIIDPSGHKIGMDPVYLQYSPFTDFLIPGIILFLVIGVLSIITAISTMKGTKYYKLQIFLQGILLSGWIAVQVMMVKDINPLHIIMFSIGLILIACGLFPEKR